MKRHWISRLLALLLLEGCTPRNLAELLSLRAHIDLVQDVPYGRHPRQRLDVYRADRTHDGAPVIVFLYGGRWQHGSKRDYRLLGDAITRQGVVAVVPDHRLYPSVRFPAWVEDAARAIRWVRDSIEHHGGDPSQIFVVGHSSGAHTATLLALDERFLEQAGVTANAVRASVSLAGPVAIQWTDPDVQALMGPREQWPATYPLVQVDGSEPPLLLLHGGKDEVVSPANAARLADRVRERGGCARLRIYEGLNHVGIVIAFSLPQLDIAPVLDEVIRFIRRPTEGC